MQSSSVTSYTLAPEQYARAIQFARAQYTLHFAAFAISAAALWLLVRWRVIPRLPRWPAIAVFAGVILWMGIADLPASLSAHELSLHYGISVETWPDWWWDWAKAQLLELLFGTAITLGIYFLLRRHPRRWWLYAWLLSIPLSVGSLIAEPYIIEPLFFHFEPLGNKHPDVLAGVEQVLQRAGVSIPPERILEMQAGEKTNSLNAYVSGFGPSKRVVLYDTIIRKEKGAPLLTTFGHELGHYVLGHITTGIAFACACSLLGFYLAHLALGWFIRTHGQQYGIIGVADPSGFPLLLLIVTVLAFVSEPIDNAFSRAQEHAADVYGLEVTHGLVPDAAQAAARAFQVEGETDLADPDPPAFIRFWMFSHPPLAERLQFALHYNPWAHDEQPVYVQ